jgi:hypothetical protein
VISNYAFSEFSRSLQEEYLELILTKSRCGYLTMNTGLSGNISLHGEPCLTVDELLDILPNAVLRREEPLTDRNNYIMIYGEHELTECSPGAFGRVA